jgi:hypothetical protein
LTFRLPEVLPRPIRRAGRLAVHFLTANYNTTAGEKIDQKRKTSKKASLNLIYNSKAIIFDAVTIKCPPNTLARGFFSATGGA